MLKKNISITDKNLVISILNSWPEAASVTDLVEVEFCLPA